MTLSEAASALNIQYKNLFTSNYHNTMMVGIDEFNIIVYLNNKNNINELPTEFEGYPVDIKVIGEIVPA